MTDIVFVRAVPVLASLDFDETVDFYEQKLGFETDSRYPDYLIMRRDTLVLHFWACSDPHIARNTSCYVQIRGVDMLYREYEAAGVVHPNGKLTDHDYGMRDFAILDGHGNLIRFGESLSAG